MEDDHEPAASYYCTNTYLIGQIDTRTEKTIGYSLPKPRIVFNIYCKNIYNHWSQVQDSTHLQLLCAYAPTCLNVPAIDLTCEQLSCTKLSHEIIHEGTKDWVPDENIRRELIARSLEIAREALLSMPEGHDSLFLDVPLFLEYHRIYLEAGSGTTDDQHGMTPASDSSIESLDNRVALDCDGSCVICMEDYNSSSSCGKVFMPCFHVFHGDCIKNWLRNSHLCPICRFEMPKKA